MLIIRCLKLLDENCLKAVDSHRLTQSGIKVYVVPGNHDVNNLWIVALDTCRYEDNKPGEEEIVSGKLSQEEENWLTNILKKANENNKAVIILGHHGLVEHWEGQSKLHLNTNFAKDANQFVFNTVEAEAYKTLI